MCAETPVPSLCPFFSRSWSALSVQVQEGAVRATETPTDRSSSSRDDRSVSWARQCLLLGISAGLETSGGSGVAHGQCPEPRGLSQEDSVTHALPDLPKCPFPGTLTHFVMETQTYMGAALGDAPADRVGEERAGVHREGRLRYLDPPES